MYPSCAKSSYGKLLGASHGYSDSNCEWSTFGTRNPNLMVGLTLTSGAIMVGAGSSLAGGNFWQGAVTGLIVSGLNHAMHGLQQSRSLSSYREELEAAIDKRVSFLDGEIGGGNLSQDGIDDLNIQKNYLLNFKNYKLPYLLGGSHGFNISLLEEEIPERVGGFQADGEVRWGDNNRELSLIHNGNINVILHELGHIYDIINGSPSLNPFVKGGVVSWKSYNSEIRAYQMSYSMGVLNDVSNWNQINQQYIINRGY